MLEKQENGIDVDEDRLYELDLFDKLQNGEQLEDMREQGESVEENMLYKLERLARSHFWGRQ